VKEIRTPPHLNKRAKLSVIAAGDDLDRDLLHAVVQSLDDPTKGACARIPSSRWRACGAGPRVSRLAGICWERRGWECLQQCVAGDADHYENKAEHADEKLSCSRCDIDTESRRASAQQPVGAVLVLAEFDLLMRYGPALQLPVKSLQVCTQKDGEHSVQPLGKTAAGLCLPAGQPRRGARYIGGMSMLAGVRPAAPSMQQAALHEALQTCEIGLGKPAVEDA